MSDHTPQNPDDPVSQGAGPAIAHLNADHDDALLDMARALAGCDEATAARCLDADRFGLTLLAATPTDELTSRIRPQLLFAAYAQQQIPAAARHSFDFQQQPIAMASTATTERAIMQPKR